MDLQVCLEWWAVRGIEESLVPGGMLASWVHQEDLGRLGFRGRLETKDLLVLKDCLESREVPVLPVHQGLTDLLALWECRGLKVPRVLLVPMVQMGRWDHQDLMDPLVREGALGCLDLLECLVYVVLRGHRVKEVMQDLLEMKANLALMGCRDLRDPLVQEVSKEREASQDLQGLKGWEAELGTRVHRAMWDLLVYQELKVLREAGEK